MFRVVILGSGRGSNAEAILQAQEDGTLGLARVVGVFSDKPEAGILKLGARFDLPAFYLDPGKYKTKLSNEAERHWIEMIDQLSPDLIVLAGYMRVIKEPFLKAFSDRIINLHPSLLPKYPGLNGIGQAFDSDDKETGCTVHWVNAEVDGGEVIDQARVPIYEDDTLEALETRVHEAEHSLLPAVICRIAEERMFGPSI
ncbi:phosphoribosylglycinamide formyltransferase [Rubellicoccus peritrichatus]|uniref:Phosphoribosylglycinamide formyltransferase n=1 Tax=Rubellicoccus peritrichatus TaxID=3080537 RepID=A0AAQ3LJA8_9BACT|nr:phosphoribosylglycinamide formyltransferase [Puniceicoccus sp. CR14]WOO43234.1 phosphoribosylglycinamide formyltransferase [Puniceicoccus sp. CR14]